ncbi:hypothetical protein [Lewinella sp. W8]|uniref:hypothetical protein n=1 Tax=Lewinella sp. W8 TaxID=2528208 RepID=UPI001068C2EB|nr:hypothetical protein [Lewinella sp. W8]MTB50061.1 hypothetical protein [Lewinella sp. W8]
MRLLKSIPKNREFYNEHGRNLRAFALIANIGQLLSAASLSLAVYTLLSDAIAGRGLTLASTIIATAAVLVGIFIELANRMLARPAIRPAVVRNQFADDPEQRKRHRLLTRFSRLGLVVVGSLSFGLSYMGSMDAGELITDQPPAPALDSLALVFQADTAALLAPYRIRAQAANEEFTATAAAKEKAAQDYAGCAARGNGWCKKKQRAILAEIDAARAAYNATLATIATERGKALAQAIKSRDAANNEERQRVAELTMEAETKSKSNGYIFAVVTASGQLVFYLMFYLILQITAGSEIEEELQPNEFNNLPSVTADLKALISHRVERGARRLIARTFGERDRLEAPLPYVSLYQEEATPPPVIAKREPRFYQRSEDPATHETTATAPRALYSTPTTHGTHEPHTATVHTKAPYMSADLREAKQRLKQYKKRLGEHKQKAIAQERKYGEVKTRTADAITNNLEKVEQWKQRVKALSNEG